MFGWVSVFPSFRVVRVCFWVLPLNRAQFQLFEGHEWVGNKIEADIRAFGGCRCKFFFLWAMSSLECKIRCYCSDRVLLLCLSCQKSFWQSQFEDDFPLNCASKGENWHPLWLRQLAILVVHNKHNTIQRKKSSFDKYREYFGLVSSDAEGRIVYSCQDHSFHECMLVIPRTRMRYTV